MRLGPDCCCWSPGAADLRRSGCGWLVPRGREACGEPQRARDASALLGPVPRYFNPWDRDDALRWATEEILLERGPVRLSLRAVMQRAQISVGSGFYLVGGRDGLMRQVAADAIRKRLSELRQRIWPHGLLAFLPANEDQLEDLRLWLTWADLLRSDPALRDLDTSAWAIELAALDEATGHTGSQDDLEALLATVWGLRHALTCRPPAMALERARGLLLAYAGRLGLEVVVDAADD